MELGEWRGERKKCRRIEEEEKWVKRVEGEEVGGRWGEKELEGDRGRIKGVGRLNGGEY